MPLQIRYTGIANADSRFNSAAQASHLLTLASMSLQIRCASIAYADIRFNVA